MTMMALDILIGLLIKQITQIEDYIQIGFDNGIILNVFNSYSYDGGVLFNITNAEVVSVTELQDYIEIKINDSGVLKVDLTDEAYQGPEALALIREGEPPVIWN